ncbi:hypothetical protein GJ496_002821 [Pomphorhynchus laevis]|nr:hypothetical protein GJ496_002821 [Pomphorhynchus laevis]
MHTDEEKLCLLKAARELNAINRFIQNTSNQYNNVASTAEIQIERRRFLSNIPSAKLGLNSKAKSIVNATIYTPKHNFRTSLEHDNINELRRHNVRSSFGYDWSPGKMSKNTMRSSLEQQHVSQKVEEYPLFGSQSSSLEDLLGDPDSSSAIKEVSKTSKRMLHRYISESEIASQKFKSADSGQQLASTKGDDISTNFDSIIKLLHQSQKQLNEERCKRHKCEKALRDLYISYLNKHASKHTDSDDRIYQKRKEYQQGRRESSSEMSTACMRNKIPRQGYLISKIYEKINSEK